MRKLFVVVLAAAAVFVWRSSAVLPATVASHFGAHGQVDGYLVRDAYRMFMTVTVVLAPLLVASTALMFRFLPLNLVNLPNREYWLAPERSAATLRDLEAMSLRFACALAVFLAYVHWLVVKANASHPPDLPESWFIGGLSAFLLVTLFWIVGLMRRFGRVP